MSQVINTNVMSLNAQRNLNTSSASLSTSIQRLSSGLRINSAKDDAAGLAISERFTTQIRGLDVATRNANDGISLAQTAEGAMVEISNNLQRVRELSVQSANATNSKTDREAMQAEVDQLVSEIDRVARQTNFNGTSLLDGSFSGQLIQIGADAGQTIGINSIINANTSALGSTQFAKETAVGTAALGDATMDLSIKDIGFTVTDKDGNKSNVALDEVKVAKGESLDKALMTAINSKMDQSGVMASLDTAGKVVLSSIKADQTFTLGAYDSTAKDFSGNAAAATAAVTTPAPAPAANNNGIALTAVAVTAFETTASTVSAVDITTVKGSQQAMTIIDKALGTVNSARADMGAIQNRFSSTIANLSTTSENLSASRSRIRDTDYAKETAELTRTQILQQAGTAMLAQANSSTQSVLSLLG
jgi:flagellin